MFSDEETRIHALRFCIAGIVLSSNELDCQTDTALESVCPNNDEQGKPLLSMWRPITAALLQQMYGGTLSRADPRHRNIQNPKRDLDRVLQPHADPSRDTDRVRNLEGIPKCGARVGSLLFSESSV
ncbi:hypothetical protein MMC07_004627 [Pseudocyphellaria aurata]|nr:hypothetical protein [Pseudocyphellaria aurata]